MKIAILGCGWLGFELGKELRALNHEVKASVTRNEKFVDLHAAGLVPYTIKLYEKGIQGDIRSFLAKSDCIVVNIPPGLRKNPEADFVSKVRTIIPYLEKSYCPRIIFVSSTSVYKNEPGFPEVRENTETDNSSNIAVQLRNAELLLLNNDNFKSEILRFGGLIGDDRHPVNQLSGKKDLSYPKAPVNLVHRRDCIKAILALIEKPATNSIYNLVYPEHPTREEYYTRIAQDRQLEAPHFSQDNASAGKKVSSERFQKEFDFKFEHSIY